MGKSSTEDRDKEEPMPFVMFRNQLDLWSRMFNSGLVLSQHYMHAAERAGAHAQAYFDEVAKEAPAKVTVGPAPAETPAQNAMPQTEPPIEPVAEQPATLPPSPPPAQPDLSAFAIPSTEDVDAANRRIASAMNSAAIKALKKSFKDSDEDDEPVSGFTAWMAFRDGA